jgi:hypothetical protein
VAEFFLCTSASLGKSAEDESIYRLLAKPLICVVGMLLMSAVPASAYVTFTATNLVHEGYDKVTVTVGIQDCAFDEGLISQIPAVGKPWGVPGSDPAIHVQAGQQDCFLYKKYLVSTLNTTEQAGQHILVQLNEGPRNGSNFNDQGHWFRAIPNELGENQWFHGIYGHLLFIDDGCCPGPRGLEVYDLDAKKSLFSILCSDASIKDGVLTFWIEEKAKASRKECPEDADWTNGPPAIERRVELDLESFKQQKTSDTRCAWRQ